MTASHASPGSPSPPPSTLPTRSPSPSSTRPPSAAPPSARRVAVVVLGVSGSGKSSVGAALAEALSVPFVDADGLHAPASVAKMRSGKPLTDDDRWPWLARVGAVLADAATHPSGVVVACSALKRAYRDRLRDAAPGVVFFFLDGPADLIAARMAARSGHYMAGAMLESQLATLERPSADETDVHALDIARSVDALADAAARECRLLRS